MRYETQIQERRRRRRGGFTLLELLTVIVIMLILMGIGVGAFVGFTRGMSTRGAVSNLKSVLQLARQHAVTHQSPTFVVFSQDGTNASYIVLARFGVCESGGPAFVTAMNEFPWDADEIKFGTVYNIDDGSHASVTRNTAVTIEGRLTGGVHNRWNRGDRIGFAIHDSEALPPGFVFEDGDPAHLPEMITFLPEGTTPRAGGDYVIRITELYVPVPTSIVVRVRGLTGWVTED
jgi:prepilin-type N-terminal cleavage/methylation domain-containing protein